MRFNDYVSYLYKKSFICGLCCTKVSYPAKTVLGILFCGGSMVLKNIKEIEKYFMKYAKELNCSDLEIIGRKGWGRAIRKNSLKFKQTGYFYEVSI